MVVAVEQVCGERARSQSHRRVSALPVAIDIFFVESSLEWELRLSRFSDFMLKLSAEIRVQKDATRVREAANARKNGQLYAHLARLKKKRLTKLKTKAGIV